MNASDIIARGRSLADLASSQFITSLDELNSLNESYRDVYSVITASDDDYYLEEATVTLTSAMAKDQYTWIVPMPVDMYKIRFVDILRGTLWEKVPRFSMESRNGGQGQLGYRMQNNNLWLTGDLTGSTGGVVRISYYPPPLAMTAPTEPFLYNEITPEYSRSAVGYPCYIENNDTCIYTLGLTIVAESRTNLTTTTLHTAAQAILGLQFNKGYIYWLTNGIVYRAPTNLLAALVPVQISPVGGTVTNFRVYDDLIYYVLATNNTYSMNLDGSGDNLLLAAATVDYTMYNSTATYVAGGVVVYGGANTTIAADQILSAGDSLYVLHDHEITKVTIDTTLLTAATTEVVTDNIAYMNQLTYDRLGVILNLDNATACISAAVDSEFDYPLNEVPEIIAYQLAIDFKRKQSIDYALLAARINELWQRYLKSVKRDEYQVEIIGNYYNQQIPSLYR